MPVIGTEVMGHSNHVNSCEGYCSGGKVIVTHKVKEAVVVGQWNSTGKSRGGDGDGIQDNHSA